MISSDFGYVCSSLTLPSIICCDKWRGQGRIQLLSKVGVHIRHTITRGVRGHAPQQEKLIFGKNIVHFL